jgi:hypothetical protein
MGATSGAGTATLPKQISSHPVISGVRVTRSLVLCVMFCRSFVLFGHSVVCSSLIDGFWLPLWYLQTLLRTGLPTYLIDGSLWSLWYHMVVWLYATVHSVPISTKVVSSNPIDGEVIQDISHLRHVGGYLLVFGLLHK